MAKVRITSNSAAAMRSIRDRMNEAAYRAASKGVRDGMLRLARAIQLDTPVDTGRARSSWTGYHALSGVAPRGLGGSRMDAEAIAEGLAAATARHDEAPSRIVAEVGSNVSYMKYLEYGRSGQAPKGMVARNIARLTEVIRKIVAGEVRIAIKGLARPKGAA